jgi:methylated-DNA-[protein]-cysteine S-methyltransferase
VTSDLGLRAIARLVVRFDSFRTPIGNVFVASSSQGICNVRFDGPDEKDCRSYLVSQADKVCDDGNALQRAIVELEAYFQGQLSQFTVPIDLRSVTDFTRRVLLATRSIPFGQLKTYGDIASVIRSPLAARAVGGALGRNPIPIIVPCHRVIAHGGKLGGFTGGLAKKRALLAIEGHMPDEVLRAIE